MSHLQRILKTLREPADAAAEAAAWQELTELARAYVRVKMGDEDRAAQESMDVVTSVLGSFAAELADGRLRFENDVHFRRHLHLAIRRKLADLGRHRRADKRGGGVAHWRVGPEASAVDPPAQEPTTSAKLQRADVEAKVRRFLTEDEYRTFTLYLAEPSWVRLGEELGISADAARHRVQRIRARLQEIGLEA